MTDRKPCMDGYQPRVSPSEIHKGYQPSQPSPTSTPNGEPGAGYQPTGAGGSPTNPSPTPPGAE
ncbi:hypothetical protein PL85_18155 [Vibrio anguillarum]|uniref:Uncharacterized protein n=1 Tax=Vibrio anguillarum TaxID=55601 RepID=A0AAW4BEK3_VIBAN|nr:hypothetical protein [Vibrio anguillarum]MBF4436565.1 hypothetical protein [Vibrio anguillarum]MBT2960851.1 hypothetical protein [Vibrio anguillarum]MBY7672795.1 hypothetical protein [Vibrio anguillarum]STY92260.1 Uncharacterised protein [Vibrio anguillarum]